MAQVCERGRERPRVRIEKRGDRGREKELLGEEEVWCTEREFWILGLKIRQGIARKYSTGHWIYIGTGYNFYIFCFYTYIFVHSIL